jgi:hypothetical protein
MRFEIDFADPHDRRQRVTIPIELTPDECRVVRMLYREGAPSAEVTAQAMALKHGYLQAPDGFHHIKGGIRQVMVQ